MGDINLRTKINNLDERVAEIEDVEEYTIDNQDVFPIPVKFVRKGSIVQIVLNGSTQYTFEQSTWSNFGTVPNSFRPKAANILYIPLYNYNGIHIGALNINKNSGLVQIWKKKVDNNHIQTSVIYLAE